MLHGILSADTKEAQRSMAKVILRNEDGSSLTVEILTSAVTFTTESPEGDLTTVNINRHKTRLLGKWLRVNNA